MLVFARSDKVARFTVFYGLGGLLGWVVVNVVFKGLIYLFYIPTILPPVILAIFYYAWRRKQNGLSGLRWCYCTACCILLTSYSCIRSPSLNTLYQQNFSETYSKPIPKHHACEDLKKQS